MLKRTNHLIWGSLALGWIFDLLFWDKPMGVSFVIFVTITLGAGFLLARHEKIKPALASIWLLAPITFFAVMSAIRLEPMTTFLNRSLTLGLMMILASSFRGGRWPLYQLWDYFMGLGTLIIAALSRAGINILATPESGEGDKKSSHTFKKAVPALRGIALAIPIIFIFGSLLSAADPVFSRYFDDFLDIFNIENLGEYIARAVLLLMIAYLLFGVYLHAYLKSEDNKLATGKNRLKPFLGFVEAAIILGSIVTLFSVFVVIQFQYFFGGQANINVEGFTYSEYARRGFFEMLLVVIFTLMLFFLMSAVTRRTDIRQQRIFSGLGITLVALVTIILVSAFQRLTLYEQAFGFTRLRAYSHVFTIWVGLLLIAAVVLEAVGRNRQFVFATLMAGLGFAATLNILNVDAFIARENISRFGTFEQQTTGNFRRTPVEERVDLSYLSSLSTDSVPSMSSLFSAAVDNNDVPVMEAAAGALVCHAYRNQDYEFNLPWQSFSLSRWLAVQEWEQLASDPDFAGNSVSFNEHEQAYVIIEGEEVACGSNFTYSD